MDFTINYPRAYLFPTDDSTKYVGTREKDGALQPIGVTVTQSAPSIIGNVETVNIKVETKIITEFDPSNP